ncbi:MAG: LacI family transcriptional regulator [Spirochaetes bacterium]|nr:LacI family transcriptional regulator [Spirochaetota bacterium]MBU1079529.1 LacI family transcriptional regulator [Spirochaetota bacterium]
MGVTIDDIASAAGVSTATISRVLNNSERVSPATRKRIEAIIKEQGYKPNIFARGLKHSQTGVVGIIVSLITNPYMTSIVESIEGTLAKNDAFIYLCNSNNDEELEHRYIEELLRRKVEALIVVESPGFNAASSFYDGLKADCPVILVNEHLHRDPRHHVVCCAQEPGLMEALNYFLARRLFPIAMILGDEGNYSCTVKERLFAEFCSGAGLGPGAAQVHRVGDANVEGVVTNAAELMSRLARSPDRPRAILAYNDMVGVGVLQGAQAAGLRVPDDIAVISVDNTLLSRISVPQLSTVDLRTADLGRMAAELYLRIRSGYIPAREASREEISSRLVLRATS